MKARLQIACLRYSDIYLFYKTLGVRIINPARIFVEAVHIRRYCK